MSKDIDNIINEILSNKKKDRIINNPINKNKNFKFSIWQRISIFLSVLIVISIFTQGFSFANVGQIFDKRSPFGTSSKPITFDLFVMSQCPYGVQFENIMFDVLDAFKDDIQYNVRYIVSERNGEYRSLHGPNELKEDLRQLCIRSIYGDEVFFNYLKCFDENYRNVNNQHSSCVNKLNLDGSLIDSCVNSESAYNMLNNDIDLTNTYNVRGSPTAFINGEKYSGARTPSAIQEAICKINPNLSGCSVELSGNTQQASGSC